METRRAPFHQPEAPGLASQKKVTTDLYANAEALNDEGTAESARGAGRRPAPPDSFQLDRAPVTGSDLLLVVMIPAIFFLGYVLGRRRRSFETSRCDINRIIR
jgi:hypothetical protein